jgi:hypothetical protein
MSSKTSKNTAARAPKVPKATKRITAIAAQMVSQMRNSERAVDMTLRLGRRWRKGLRFVAAGAFSDAFAGFCAVYTIRNGRSTIDHMVRAFLTAMRAELEARERAEFGKRKGGAK